MAATKNLCAQIGLDLHQKISEAREQAGLTTAQYISNQMDRTIPTGDGPVQLHKQHKGLKGGQHGVTAKAPWERE